jgi:ATP-dependent DNA helicase RecG
MFADDIKRFIPYSETILGAFKGINKTHIYDRKDVRDDLLTQFNESILFLQKHLNVRSEIRGVNRYDIYEIPIDALREAVVNAIIHRDYSMRGTNISVNVFDDRVEIVNPGGLPSGLTKENFGKESVRRNLFIADLFHRMRKVERVGSGIGRMREFMKQAGLKEPVFESDTFFRAIFYRNPEYALKRIPEVTRKSIQKTSRKHPENN